MTFHAARPVAALTATLERLGRALLGSLFFLGGINKLLDPERTLSSMQAVGLEPAGPLLAATIALELAGGICVMTLRTGITLRIAAGALALFTVAANLAYHDFWNLEEARASAELSAFFKNVSVIGGLLVVAALAIPPETRETST